MNFVKQKTIGKNNHNLSLRTYYVVGYPLKPQKNAQKKHLLIKAL